MFAEPGNIYLSLENEMNVRQLLAAAAMMTMAGSALAQKQTTWVVPDAGFKSAITRAEVRNELRNGDWGAWHRRDGQDVVYSAAPQSRSRNDVRTEIARTARAQHTTNVNGVYFGD